MNNLYSYPKSWSNSKYGKILESTIKRSYGGKSLLLTFFLPFDILVISFLMVVKKQKIQFIVATEKWKELPAELALIGSVGCITDPSKLFTCLKNKCIYIPASVFYIPAALGLLFGKAEKQEKYSEFVIKFTKFLLKKFGLKNAVTIVHSDALPFARSLVISSNQIGYHTICIQHGTFREEIVIHEQDGFLCKTNFARSIQDGRIIKRHSPLTNIIVDEFFFKLKRDFKADRQSSLKVLLVGEGYHIIDPEFSDVYISKLILLAKELEREGFNVVYRPHPSESKMNWRKVFKFVDRMPLQKTVLDTAAVIGYSSTLLHEMSELGIPSFFLDVLENDHKIEGRNKNIIYKFNDFENFKTIVDKFSTNFEDRYKFKGLGGDYSQSKNLISFIVELVENN